MSQESLYTVPNEVLFRNYSTLSGPQTRNLLFKNTTNQVIRTLVSYPFTPCFRVHPPADGGQLLPNPPHLVLQLQPNSTCKVRGSKL